MEASSVNSKPLEIVVVNDHSRDNTALSPLISCHFNLTVEMPLKAIIRGYKWTAVPTNWCGRAAGVSKCNIKEMGSRYFFIVLYLLLEKLLSRNAYHRNVLQFRNSG